MTWSWVIDCVRRVTREGVSSCSAGTFTLLCHLGRRESDLPVRQW